MDQQQVDCIYCGPGKLASKEHVVPQAIGGSFSSSTIICEECNSYFGAQVDPHITNWHLSLAARNWFDLEGYSGKVPSYEVEASDGSLITVGRKGALRPKWRDVVKKAEGNEFYFSAGTPTADEAHAAIADIIARQTAIHGRAPNVAVSKVTCNTRREWEAFGADVEYDYAKQGRAIAKMALHYLATQLDRRFLQTRDFELIKRFVRHGEHPVHPRLCQPAIPSELKDVATCIQHSLALRCSRSLRSAVCDVTLFGMLRYSVVLSYKYEGPDLYRRLVEYPLERRWEEGPAPELTPMPARVILNVDKNERQSRYDRLEEAVHELVDWLNHYGFCHYVRETIPRVIEHLDLVAHLADDGVEAWLAAVADEFSDRSAPAALLHFLGEPSRVAAQILLDELQQSGAAAGVSLDDLEERFAKLIYIRLIVDALALLIQSRDAAEKQPA